MRPEVSWIELEGRKLSDAIQYWKCVLMVERMRKLTQVVSVNVTSRDQGEFPINMAVELS
jgi:hypothetical protein